MIRLQHRLRGRVLQVLTSVVRAQTRSRRLQIRLRDRLADLHEQSSILRYIKSRADARKE